MVNPVGCGHMGAHMKTTIKISDPLLEDARRIAAREGITIGALVEQGLRRVVMERKRAAAFQLRRATFKGDGLRPGQRDATW
jgi:hypothetical protein